MTRSLPEKTFEHWCSIHLNYRYRSHLQMWWPSIGADIEAARLPGAFGKRIWLELKTVEWNAKQGRHDLSIDLRQLDAYGNATVPDYYVFPVPKWQGVLGHASSMSWLGAQSTPALAYQTRSGEKWFADWTFVVPGHVLRRCLAKQVTASVRSGKGTQLRIAEVQNGELTWVASGLAGVHPILWKNFWKLMEQCGSPEFPAQFVLPGTFGGGSPVGNGPTPVTPKVPRSWLVAALQRVAIESKSEDAATTQEISLYRQTINDEYTTVPLDGGDLVGGFVWDSTRALILIEAGGLRL